MTRAITYAIVAVLVLMLSIAQTMAAIIEKSSTSLSPRDSSLFDCYGCQLIARSDSDRPIKDGLDCDKELADSVISDYMGSGDGVNTHYVLFRRRAIHVETATGEHDIIKGVNFYDLALTPDDLGGFTKADYSCSNGMTGIADCRYCRGV